MWNRIIRQIIVHVVNMSVVYHRAGLPHCSELLPFTLSGISRPPWFFSFKVGETDHVNTDPLWICDCSMCFPNCRMGTNQNTYLISNMKGIQSHHIGAQLGTRDDTCCIELFDEFPCLFGRLWYQTWGHSIRSIASEHPLGVWYTVPLFSTACKLKLKIKYKSPPKKILHVH